MSIDPVQQREWRKNERQNEEWFKLQRAAEEHARKLGPKPVIYAWMLRKF